MSVRSELVQVAAVAQAMVQLMDTGHTRLDTHLGVQQAHAVALAVEQERHDQYERWGDQQHLMEQWVCILVEEVGEAVQAINDRYVFPKIAGP